ncbi:MAG: FAD-dependent oxidoreductase [Patescibacteria group bacterium]
MSAHRIVILGGGFGGLLTALELERRCGRVEECAVTLIDRASEHLYTPLLYEVASGFLQKTGRVCRGELKGGVCVSFEQYREIIGSRHIRFVRGEVVGLDRQAKQVLLKDGEPVIYDDLVIAIGAQTNYYGIKGLTEHAFPMKTLPEAYKLRARVHEFLERYRDGVEQNIDIVVGGAGATGTELAGELGNFFSRLTREKALVKTAWSVRLIEAGPEILSAFTPGVRQLARERLAVLGVTVLTDTKIEELKEKTITLTAQGKREETEADVTVWCGGIQPNAIISTLGLPLGPKGHLDIDAFLRVKGEEEIFALGDATAVAPPLAQAAIAQAATLAENLIRHVEQKPLSVWKTKKTWPAIIPIGGRWAIFTIGAFVAHGRFGYLARKAADARYLFRILPFKEAWQVWFKGAKTYLSND